MREEILLDVLKSQSYLTSVITTYSAYLPLYEEVILPKLRAAGCRHNIVMVDARQLATGFTDPSTTPKRAGRDYILLPMCSDAAFHPKIWLLAGQRSASLYVGSHNLTIAGLGYNRELTNLLKIRATDKPEILEPVRAAWEALAAWVQSPRQYFPETVIDAFTSIPRLAPWLKEPRKPSADATTLVQGIDTDSLWDQLRRHINGKPTRILVWGAFFDANLRFLATLRSFAPKAKLTIAVDPQTVEFAASTDILERYDIRDASKLAERPGYLHAKGLYIECQETPRYLLATGSANPSPQGWLMGAPNGNDEAIIVRTGTNASTAARDLGLLDLFECPTVSQQVFTSRRAATVAEETNQDPSLQFLVANASADVICFPCRTAPFELSATIEILDRQGRQLDGFSNLKSHNDQSWVEAITANVSDVATIKITRPRKPTLIAIVHHAEQLLANTKSTRQAQLSVALASLGGDSTDLTKLISLVQKVIFDEKIDAVDSHGTQHGSDSEADTEEKHAARPSSLSVELTETRSAKRARRLVRSGSIADLLNALIHRLGIGLETSPLDRDSSGRTEEEQIGQQDEGSSQEQGTQNPGSPEATGTDWGTHTRIEDVEVARSCQRKVRNLVTRMLDQLEQASAKQDRKPDVILQLVAVLALLRELRSIEQNQRWRATHEQLVPQEQLERILRGSFRCLFGRDYDLFAAITTALQDEMFDELYRLKGLLIWICWEADVRINDSYGISEEADEIGLRVENKAYLVQLAQMLPEDDFAYEEARSSIIRLNRGSSLPRASRWLSELHTWCKTVMIRFHGLPKGDAGGRFAIGHLALAPTIPARLRVVSRVEDSRITLFDFGPESAEISYRRDKVVTIGA